MKKPGRTLVSLLIAVLTSVIPSAWCSADPPSESQQNPDSDRSVRGLVRLPSAPFHYGNIDLPQHFRRAAGRFDNTPSDNSITDHGATLGRVLFYDNTLSINGTTSCASCHKQEFAFTDDRKLSVGFGGAKVKRNSMSLINTRFYRRGKFFWDERASSLEAQVLMPIENEIEMGHDLAALIIQLQSDPLYPPLFKEAFGSEQVTAERIAKALAQFVRSIVSYRSKYDVGRAKVQSVLDPFPNFTDQENYGKQQFFGRANCANCHLADTHQAEDSARQTAFFYVEAPVVNGIDSEVESADTGVGGRSGLGRDVGRFKAPSLRNVELTSPYMHDGRFVTLDQVIEHYNWSVRPHKNLDRRLQDIAANGLALPEVEKVALTKFLTTLTDHKLTKDPKFSDPFER
jgi:cytochrome c peroxidase